VSVMDAHANVFRERGGRRVSRSGNVLLLIAGWLAGCCDTHRRSSMSGAVSLCEVCRWIVRTHIILWALLWWWPA